MSLKLYFDLLSQPSRALVIFLKTLKIPYESCPVALGKGAHLTSEFEEINRFKKVPCIVDNGFKLSESVAIIRYLAREKSVPEQWYPKESKKQARIDEYLEWQHLGLRMECSAFFIAKYLNPLITGKEANAKKVEYLKQSMEVALDKLQDLWLTPGPFILGDKISAADLFAACEIEQPKMAGYDPCKGRPILDAWLKRVRTETAPHYDEATEKLYRIAKQPPTSLSKL